MQKGIVVIGAGGHAKVCIEILQAMGQSVAYCVGGDGGAVECVGVPVVNGDENISRLREDGHEDAFVAVGSNRLRKHLASMVTAHGYRLVNAISPAAHISPSARLGAGIAVMAGVIVNADTVIEDLVIINTGATVDHDCRIGLAAHIAPQGAVAGNVRIGANSFLGIGCKVIPGVAIGDNVTLGAGSVVISDIPSAVVALGVPAKIIKHIQS